MSEIEAAERLRRVQATSVTDVYGLYRLGNDANDYRAKYTADLLVLADAYLRLVTDNARAAAGRLRRVFHEDEPDPLVPDIAEDDRQLIRDDILLLAALGVQQPCTP